MAVVGMDRPIKPEIRASGQDTAFRHQTNSSCILLGLEQRSVELELHVHSLAFMEMHMNSCGPFVVPQCIHLLQRRMRASDRPGN